MSQSKFDFLYFFFWFFLWPWKKVEQLLSIVDQRNELVGLMEEQRGSNISFDSSSTDYDISDYHDSEQSH